MRNYIIFYIIMGLRKKNKKKLEKLKTKDYIYNI